MVGAGGDLLAYGIGRPPFWSATAVSAEAWALQVVPEDCPFPQAICTVCQALITIAEAGTASRQRDPPLKALCEGLEESGAQRR